MKTTTLLPSALLAVCLSLCLPQPLAAQKAVWKIPERGVVFYERSADLIPAGKAVPGFGTVVNPAVLMQSELDFKQKQVAAPPEDLRELAAYLAFDLRRVKKKQGKFKELIPILLPFGSLQISGRTSTTDADGRQIIQATIRRGEPVQGKICDSVFNRHIRAGATHDLVGSITIHRQFDLEKGLVTRFDSVLEAKLSRILGGPAAVRRGFRGETPPEFSYEETWEFDRVEENRYRGFTAKVAEAIRLGAEHVKRQIREPDGRQVGATPAAKGWSRNTGRLALCLLTLLKAEVDRDDPVIVDGFDSLRRRVIKGSYAVSLSLMAMEALYAPLNERQLFIEGRIRKPIERKPSAEDKKLMQEWVKELLTYTDIRVKNQAYLMRFNYVSGVPRYDNSNSQYALLGLYSAYLCGVEISPTVWFACANHWLDCQFQVKDNSIALRLVSRRDYEKYRKDQAQEQGSKSRSKRRTRRTLSSSKKVEVAGWPYVGVVGPRQQLRNPLTGSMTTAGITALTICDAALRSNKKGGEVLSKIQTAIRTGYAWMLDNFSVRHNKFKHSHHFYYLYGLERAAELGRIALIGDRDWYFEGATMLLGMQTPRGSFSGAALHGTCFAILFLKQAAPPLPVITGR